MRLPFVPKAYYAYSPVSYYRNRLLGVAPKWVG